MAVTKDEILDSISKMTVLEVVELISDMEKKVRRHGCRSGCGGCCSGCRGCRRCSG